MSQILYRIGGNPMPARGCRFLPSLHRVNKRLHSMEGNPKENLDQVSALTLEVHSNVTPFLLR